jgi:hypothetical protein
MADRKVLFRSGAGLNEASTTVDRISSAGIVSGAADIVFSRNGSTTDRVTIASGQTTIDNPFITTSSATRAAIRIGSVAGDPSSLTNGDLWNDSSTATFRHRVNGVSQTIADIDRAQTWTAVQTFTTAPAFPAAPTFSNSESSLVVGAAISFSTFGNPTVAGNLTRGAGGTTLKFHDGTAARTVVFLETAQSFSSTVTVGGAFTASSTSQFNGLASFTATAEFNNGAVATPSIRSTAQPTTGISWTNGPTISTSVSAVEIWRGVSTTQISQVSTHIGSVSVAPTATLSIGGDIGMAHVSPAAIAVSQNDYAGMSGFSAARLTASAAVNITGIAAGSAGRLLMITNIGATNAITFTNQDVLSAAANRLINVGGQSTVLQAGGTVWYRYDETTLRWRQMLQGGRDLVPSVDNTGNVGTASLRWNLVRATTVTSGDLNLFDEERGAMWTLREEPDCITAINRVTGKRYKLALEEIEE